MKGKYETRNQYEKKVLTLKQMGCLNTFKSEMAKMRLWHVTGGFKNTGKSSEAQTLTSFCCISALFIMYETFEIHVSRKFGARDNYDGLINHSSSLESKKGKKR